MIFGLILAIFPCKRGKIENAKKTAEVGLKSKNARKQIHCKIQFYIGIHVTSFDFGHFLLWWSKSTYPTRDVDLALYLWRLGERKTMQWMIDNGRRRAGWLSSDLGARSRDGERQPSKSSHSPHNTRSQLINFKIFRTNISLKQGSLLFLPGPYQIPFA